MATKLIFGGLRPGGGPPGPAGGPGMGRGAAALSVDLKKKDSEPKAPANASAEYPEDKIEAAVMLQGFKDMLNANADKAVGKDNTGRDVTERDYLASILADRMNRMPIYQKEFGVGDGTGRKVVGFQHVSDPESLPDELKGRLPADAIIPMIRNDKTQSYGPMTKRASADPDDEVMFITLSDLEQMAQE